MSDVAADIAAYRAKAKAVREGHAQLAALCAPLTGIDGAVESRAAELSRDNYRAMHGDVTDSVNTLGSVVLAEAAEIEKWCDLTEAIQKKAKENVETISPKPSGPTKIAGGDVHPDGTVHV